MKSVLFWITYQIQFYKNFLLRKQISHFQRYLTSSPCAPTYSAVQCQWNPHWRHMLQAQKPCGICRSLGTRSHAFLFPLPHRCVLWQLRQTDQVRWLLWEVSAPADALPVLPRVLLSLQLCLPELHFPERVWLWGWGQRRRAQDAESPSGITGSQRGRREGKWIWKAIVE